MSRFFGSETQEEALARTSLSRASRDAARNFSFRKLCRYLDSELKDHSSLSQAAFDELIRDFNSSINVTKEDENPGQSDAYSPFMLIRLLIPSFDRRKVFLTPRTLRKSLENFIKAPFSVSRHCADEYARFVAKHSTGTSKELSIDDVNKFLDTIAFDRPKRDPTIQELCMKMDENELAWFFRILFNEIADKIAGRATGGPTALINYLAPSAKQLYHAGMSLLTICIGAFQAGDSKERLVTNVILGKSVRPMLLSKITCDEDGILKVIKHCGRPFYLETKFDGEHIMIHRMCGENYSYFTRNGNDYSDHFGRESNAGFSARLHPFFREDVEDCVLDCELVIWDQEKQKVLGKNRETEYGRVMDVKHLEDNDPRFQRVAVVLDLLFLNDEGFFEVPLAKRLEVLRTRIFKEELDAATVQISEQIECSKVQDLRNYYTEHLKNGEEGIVIKGKMTKYYFGQRMAVNGWFKVKPDYGARLTLDLVIVGVRYENKDHQKFRSFLIAALTNDQNFHIIGGIQPSLKKPDLDRLMEQFDLQKTGLHKQPPWLVGHTKNPTTIYIAFDHIAVVEVKASGLINGKLQFPVITDLRMDKSWDEINLYSEVMSYEGKLREHKRLEPNSFFVLHRSKRRRVVQSADLHQISNTARRHIPQTLLNGVEVLVIDDTKDRELLSNCRQNVRMMGATLIENYVRSVKFAISVNPTGRKTKIRKEKDELNIVSGSWTQRCVEAKKILPWDQTEMIHACSDSTAFNLYTVDEENSEFPGDAKEEEQMADAPVQRPEHEERGLLIDEATDADIREKVADELDDRLNSYAVDGEPFAVDMDDNTRSEIGDDVVEAMEAQSLDDDLPAADEDALFDGLQFHALGHTSGTMDSGYKRKILMNGGALVDELNDRITHLFFQEKYDFESDPHGLMPWLTRTQWTWVFTDPKWVDRALEEKERYLEPVPVPDVKIPV